MIRRLPYLTTCLAMAILFYARSVRADERPAIELLLPSGTLYSIAHRSYQSLLLPEGWTVMAGAYSPDGQTLALLLVGSGISPKPKAPPDSKLKSKTKPKALPQEGPVNKIVKLWADSSRLILINRQTGVLSRSWRLTTEGALAEWKVFWTSAALLGVSAHDPGAPSESSEQIFEFDVVRNLALKPRSAAQPVTAPIATDGCIRTLADTSFAGKNMRFTVEPARCAAPPQTSDFYRLVRLNERTHKDAILWEKRVAAEKNACLEPYACYTGGDVQFLAAGDRLFLAWDGDLYPIKETDDGLEVELDTQLLPQYSHPWAMAAGETQLSLLDVANKVTFQPVTAGLFIGRAENPRLYAQNFCLTRSFNAAVIVGPYTNSLMVPAGYQVGPVEPGSFKDRAYTPVLVSVTWTSFHNITNALFCEQPYTLSPYTRGIVVSITQDERGVPQCHINFQEDH